MPHTALLIIDAQNEMFDPANPVHESDKVLENLQTLIQNARSADVPVIYVQHKDAGLVEGTDFWQIHKTIKPEAGDLIVQKKSPDSFHETVLLEALKKRFKTSSLPAIKPSIASTRLPKAPASTVSM